MWPCGSPSRFIPWMWRTSRIVFQGQICACAAALPNKWVYFISVCSPTWPGSWPFYFLLHEYKFKTYFLTKSVWMLLAEAPWVPDLQVSGRQSRGRFCWLPWIDQTKPWWILKLGVHFSEAPEYSLWFTHHFKVFILLLFFFWRCRRDRREENCWGMIWNFSQGCGQCGDE